MKAKEWSHFDLWVQEACLDQAQYLKENLAGYEFADEYRNFPSR